MDQEPAETLSIHADTDAYFKLLDAAPVGPHSLLRSETDKERYETALMYVYRKHAAAVYHLGNVDHLLKRDQERAGNGLKEGISKESPPAKTSTWVARSAPEYVYELAAFLSALKSALDFLAIVALKHVRGISGDSIRNLMRAVEKGAKGPIFGVVSRHLDWLTDLRDYRHHLIHRVVVTTSAGFHSRSEGEVSAKASFPVVVPKEPRHTPDTRGAMIMAPSGELPPGLQMTTFTQRFVKQKGAGTRVETSISTHMSVSPASFEQNVAKAVADQGFLDEIAVAAGAGDKMSISITPAPGYVRIEQFMREHLSRFGAFYKEMLESLGSLNFGTFLPGAPPR